MSAPIQKRDMRECITPPDDGRFHCMRGCGDSWDKDPRLAVDCPQCGSRAGTPCRRPSEHRLSSRFADPHKARCEKSFALNPCSCLAKWDAEHKQ
jgi:hypothetical protein